MSNSIYKYLTSSLKIVEKAAINSLDDEKAAYKESITPDVEDSSEIDETTLDEVSEIEDGNFDNVVKIVVIAVIVVALGVLIVFLVKNKGKK